MWGLHVFVSMLLYMFVHMFVYVLIHMFVHVGPDGFEPNRTGLQDMSSSVWLHSVNHLIFLWDAGQTERRLSFCCRTRGFSSHGFQTLLWRHLLGNGNKASSDLWMLCPHSTKSRPLHLRHLSEDKVEAVQLNFAALLRQMKLKLVERLKLYCSD